MIMAEGVSRACVGFLVQSKIDLSVVDVFPPFHARSLAEKLSAMQGAGRLSRSVER